MKYLNKKDLEKLGLYNARNELQYNEDTKMFERKPVASPPVNTPQTLSNATEAEAGEKYTSENKKDEDD